MNRIEHDIIIRCLGIVYGQLLSDEAGHGLQSIERLTALVRYLAKAEPPVSALQEELQVIWQVFQIYQAEEGPEFRVETRDLDPQMRVGHNTLLYEICQHGMELLHNGCQLRHVVVFQDGGQLAYTFTDADGQSYGGMIYGENGDPEGGA